MSEATVTARLRRYIKLRRAAIVERYRKKLSPDEYMFTCGQHQELDDLEAILQDAVRKANSAEGDTDAPVDDD